MSTESARDALTRKFNLAIIPAVWTIIEQHSEPGDGPPAFVYDAALSALMNRLVRMALYCGVEQETVRACLGVFWDAVERETVERGFTAKGSEGAPALRVLPGGRETRDTDPSPTGGAA